MNPFKNKLHTKDLEDIYVKREVVRKDLAEQLDTDNQPDNFWVIGEVGSGKTTLMKKLKRDLSEGTDIGKANFSGRKEKNHVTYNKYDRKDHVYYTDEPPTTFKELTKVVFDEFFENYLGLRLAPNGKEVWWNKEEHPSHGTQKHHEKYKSRLLDLFQPKRLKYKSYYVEFQKDINKVKDIYIQYKKLIKQKNPNPHINLVNDVWAPITHTLTNPYSTKRIWFLLDEANEFHELKNKESLHNVFWGGHPFNFVVAAYPETMWSLMSSSKATFDRICEKVKLPPFTNEEAVKLYKKRCNASEYPEYLTEKQIHYINQEVEGSPRKLVKTLKKIYDCPGEERTEKELKKAIEQTEAEEATKKFKVFVDKEIKTEKAETIIKNTITLTTKCKDHVTRRKLIEIKHNNKKINHVTISKYVKALVNKGWLKQSLMKKERIYKPTPELENLTHSSKWKKILEDAV